MSTRDFEESAALVLAAEECPDADFSDLHKFSSHDEQIITKLMAHGPVLLRGSRGSGKSALMLEAARRIKRQEAPIVGIYISLRHFKLLRAESEEYEQLLCEMIADHVRRETDDSIDSLTNTSNAMDLQHALTNLTSRKSIRLVLFLDDAAHLGREASLSDFFDVFRTLASRTVSCKATIYPGVTRFGNRFDVLNDATVIEIARSEDLSNFGEQFLEVMEARYPDGLDKAKFGRSLSKKQMAEFMGRAVLGNMRAFVFACNQLKQHRSTKTFGLHDLGQSLLKLATDYYWPLLEEIRPKLGFYEPMTGAAQELGEQLFKTCGEKEKSPRTILVHRDVTARLAKPIEILEYAGFITKREASRAMKSGGRGSGFHLNLCNLLERTPGSRLTQALWKSWKGSGEPVEFHRTGHLARFELPTLESERSLAILAESIETLRRSNAYPYGLTDAKIEILLNAGFRTVKDVAEASDETLKAITSIGDVHLLRIRNVIGQAIWM